VSFIVCVKWLKANREMTRIKNTEKGDGNKLIKNVEMIILNRLVTKAEVVELVDTPS
jgi:hypothetical protein